jgi:hypothetical protein
MTDELDYWTMEAVDDAHEEPRECCDGCGDELDECACDDHDPSTQRN